MLASTRILAGVLALTLGGADAASVVAAK